MKKTLLILTMVVVGAITLGAGQALAVSVPPVTDGALGVGEWANINHSGSPYPYYLEVFDPNEADNIIDDMDMSHVVLLQELSFGSDGPAGSAADDGTAGFGDDGVYLLIEVYAPPPSLAFATGPGVTATTAPVIMLQGDLLGDGLSDGFNIFIRHFNSLPGTGLVANDIVEVCVGSLATCGSISAVYTDLVGAGGSFGRGAVLEYFLPAGTFFTPPSPPGTPFPFNFIGTVTYDNGASGPNTSDDVVMGTLIPEPGTMFLLGSSLLGMIGMGKVRFWQ